MTPGSRVAFWLFVNDCERSQHLSLSNAAKETTPVRQMVCLADTVKQALLLEDENDFDLNRLSHRFPPRGRQLCMLMGPNRPPPCYPFFRVGWTSFILSHPKFFYQKRTHLNHQIPRTPSLRSLHTGSDQHDPPGSHGAPVAWGERPASGRSLLARQGLRRGEIAVDPGDQDDAPTGLAHLKPLSEASASGPTEATDARSRRMKRSFSFRFQVRGRGVV